MTKINLLLYPAEETLCSFNPITICTKLKEYLDFKNLFE
jgi:hypothetical protein